MPRVSNRERALNKLAHATDTVRDYFWMLEELLEEISYPEPALAYCFQRIESGQRVSLYALLMRKYRTDSELAWEAVDRLDITRSNFPQFYEAISGRSYPHEIREILKPAEAVRDRITHGKDESEAEVLKAICTCLEYAEALNEKMFADVGFRPFGRLQGVTSSRRPQLEKDITRLVIRGLGLDGSRGR